MSLIYSLLEIHKAADGKTEYIDHIQVKTKDRVTIPLSEETKKWMPKREMGKSYFFPFVDKLPSGCIQKNACVQINLQDLSGHRLFHVQFNL